MKGILAFLGGGKKHLLGRRDNQQENRWTRYIQIMISAMKKTEAKHRDAGENTRGSCTEEKVPKDKQEDFSCTK